jgi:hypothetical protein
VLAENRQKKPFYFVIIDDPYTRKKLVVLSGSFDAAGRFTLPAPCTFGGIYHYVFRFHEITHLESIATKAFGAFCIMNIYSNILCIMTFIVKKKNKKMLLNLIFII